MVAHQGVTPVPVDLAMHCCPHHRRIPVEPMNHLCAGLTDFDHGGRATLPRERSHVVRLATTRWVERGSIENQPTVRRHLYDRGIESAYVRVSRVQLLGLAHGEM